MVQDTVQVGKGPAIHVPGNGLLKRSLPQRGSLMERREGTLRPTEEKRQTQRGSSSLGEKGITSLSSIYLFIFYFFKVWVILLSVSPCLGAEGGKGGEAGMVGC